MQLNALTSRPRHTPDPTEPGLARSETTAGGRADQSASASSPATRDTDERAGDPRAVVSLTQSRSATKSAGPSAAQVLRRLDAHREAFAGPYLVDGKKLHVDPQFRMMGGFGTGPDQALELAKRALAPEVYQELASQIAMVASGKASAPMLVRVTQALIDAGAHRELGSGEEAVRKMMWKHGIGVDCSGYTRSAFLASRGVSEQQAGRYGIPKSSDGFNPNVMSGFRKVAPEQVRAGDVCVLGRVGDGHKVIVASHSLIPGGNKVEVPGHQGPLPSSFTQGGPIHLMEVDSSWGAGRDGSESGGVRRALWLYNESSKSWASIDYYGAFRPSKSSGPYDYPLTGFYRPRQER
ncbi:MAG: hypothetical protein KIT72_05125 [Polyangiaceae bacterium]|nr:hypothetical protein [Polyangiaceae bacterium]MCW5789786.1 hypothetical protein [Polyangiaceae bacterium]